MDHSLTVQDCMSGSLITFRQNMDILDAAQRLVDSRISGAPVLDQLGNLVGILSERDCLQIVLQAGYYHESGGKVEKFMTKDVQTVDYDTPIIEVAERFIAGHVRRFPVIREGRVVGVISRRDIIRQLEKIM